MAIGLVVSDHIVMAVTATVLIEISLSMTESASGEAVGGMADGAILGRR